MELLAPGVGNSYRLMRLVSDVETRGVSAPSMVIRICFVSDNRATAARGEENPFMAVGGCKASTGAPRQGPAELPHSGTGGTPKRPRVEHGA